MENNYLIIYKWVGRNNKDDELSMNFYCKESDLLKTIKEIQQVGNIIISINLLSK